MEAIRSILSQKQSAREVVQYILELKERSQMHVIILLWQWWLERNRVREGDRRREAVGLAGVISRQSDEFLTIGREDQPQLIHRQKHWRKPHRGTFKINTDGAFLLNTGEGGWGYVIRDEEGNVIRAGAGRSSHLLDAFHAEVNACLRGVSAADELGMNKVVIETDSMLLKLALESNSFALAPTGGIVFEIKSYLNVSFSEWAIVFSPRECNRVAHVMAAQGCKCSHDTVLQWDGTPPGVEDLVASDITEPLS
ncbi:unnamed protein product [Urochloa humidicola]